MPHLKKITATVVALFCLSACSGQASTSPAGSAAPSGAAPASSSASATPSSVASSPAASSPVASSSTPEASSSSTPSPSSSAGEEAAGAKTTDQVKAVDGVVDGADVARSTSDELTKIVGRSPDSVTCPDLKAKVGTTIRCKLTDGADVYGVTVTTTTVQGSNVRFSIQVDGSPQ